MNNKLIVTYESVRGADNVCTLTICGAANDSVHAEENSGKFDKALTEAQAVVGVEYHPLTLWESVEQPEMLRLSA